MYVFIDILCRSRLFIKLTAIYRALPWRVIETWRGWGCDSTVLHIQLEIWCTYLGYMLFHLSYFFQHFTAISEDGKGLINLYGMRQWVCALASYHFTNALGKTNAINIQWLNVTGHDNSECHSIGQTNSHTLTPLVSFAVFSGKSTYQLLRVVPVY